MKKFISIMLCSFLIGMCTSVAYEDVGKKDHPSCSVSKVSKTEVAKAASFEFKNINRQESLADNTIAQKCGIVYSSPAKIEKSFIYNWPVISPVRHSNKNFIFYRIHSGKSIHLINCSIRKLSCETVAAV